MYGEPATKVISIQEFLVATRVEDQGRTLGEWVVAAFQALADSAPPMRMSAPSPAAPAFARALNDRDELACAAMRVPSSIAIAPYRAS